LVILFELLCGGATAQIPVDPQIPGGAQIPGEAHHPKLFSGNPTRFVIFPVIVKSPEYKWGGGFAGTYFFSQRRDSITRTSNIKAVSFGTVRKQLVFAAEANIYFPSEKYILHTIASASRFPDKFWGIGNNTASSNLENYAISQVDIFPQLLRKTFQDFYVGIGYEYQNVFAFNYNTDGGSLFDKERVTGRYGGHISGPSLLLTWDSRNNAFSSSKGFYAQYLFGSYQNYLGSSFNFTIQNWDIRKYFSLKTKGVLAFQFNMIITDGNVPIRQLTNIGSSSYMRGYYEGRYTDQDLIAAQVEYRSPMWRRFGAVIFARVGKVSPRFPELVDFVNLKPSVGFGLRFAVSPREKLNFRVDAGFGNQSQGTYINMGEAF
jgi:hypothetical protein